ncbi:hypothetical protein [Reichenbachiella sp.]
MRKIIYALVWLALVSCSDDEVTIDDNTGTNGEIVVTSDAVASGELLDDYKCESKDNDIEASIPISWSGVPETAGSLAIMMYHFPNADDQTNANSYLLLWGIDPSVTSIAHGGADDGNWYIGSNKDGTAISYTSPCSPSAGSHEYTITVYALSETPASLPTENTLEVDYETLKAAIESVTLVSSGSLTFNDVTE